MTDSITRKLIVQGAITDPVSARGKLLSCAVKLFRSKGFERSTVRELAALAGIQSGSIFHHFSSKEDILVAVMRETILLNIERMRRALAQGNDLKERIFSLIVTELESIHGRTGSAMSLLVFEWRSLSVENQNAILELRKVYEALWLQTLAEAKSAGVIKTDEVILRRLLTGAISWTSNWFKDSGELSIEQLAQEILEMIVVHSEPGTRPDENSS